MSLVKKIGQGLKEKVPLHFGLSGNRCSFRLPYIFFHRNAYATVRFPRIDSRGEKQDNFDLAHKKVSAVEGFRDISNERMYSLESLEKQAKYPSMKNLPKASSEGQGNGSSSNIFGAENQGEIGHKRKGVRKSRSELKAEARARARVFESFCCFFVPVFCAFLAG